MAILPRKPFPKLEMETLSGERFALDRRTPERFTMLVAYRGYHCPICRGYLRDLDRKLDEFAKRGVEVIAFSTDDQERAEMARRDWGLEKLTIGYGVSLEKARELGLYISSSRGKTSTGVEEPALFAEPGLFLVRADGTLYFASIQTMPFARPSFAEVLGALDYVIANDYPARGEA